MKKTSLMKYNEIMANCGPETDPLERLRLFLSIALNGDDWLDVEPFLEDISAKIDIHTYLNNQWFEKTECVQEWSSKGMLPIKWLGMHRADILANLARNYLEKDYD